MIHNNVPYPKKNCKLPKTEWRGKKPQETCRREKEKRKRKARILGSGIGFKNRKAGGREGFWKSPWFAPHVEANQKNRTTKGNINTWEPRLGGKLW